jgi:LysM repeat protein
MFEREGKDPQMNVRLTKLSKAILVAIALVVAASFFSTNAMASAAGTKAHFNYVTVNAGETLWSMAATYGKGQDARDWIANLVDLNNLTTNNLQAGQRLALPN